MRSLAPLVTLAAVATLTVACCRATPEPAAGPNRVVDPRTHAERAEARSVALLDKDGGPDCGGVWISRTEIITKYHCIDEAGRPAIYSMLEALGQDPHALGLPDYKPVGGAVPFAVKNGDKYTALVLAVDDDPQVDLALLAMVTPPPEHDIAFISDRELHDGEALDVVGSTVGHGFTYSHCYVAATRLDWLQVSGPVFFGNSGGGAFDDQGHLVGLADHIQGNPQRGYVPGMSFFSSGRAMRRFLSAADAATGG